MVIAINELVPAQLMVDSALSSFAMVGKATPIPFWSTKEVNNETASALYTINIRFLGRMLVWSKTAASAAFCCSFMMGSGRLKEISELRKIL